MNESRNNVTEKNLVIQQIKTPEKTPQIVVECDPFLHKRSEQLTPEARALLEEKQQDIAVRYSVIADELHKQHKELVIRNQALSELAGYEINLQYIDALLGTKQYEDDMLLKLAKEIAWREHLYGIMVLNDCKVLEICKVAHDQIKYVIVVSDEPLSTACDWRNSTFEEGLTWLPIPARKTRLSLGVFAPAANGVPICTVVASSAQARKLLATGEDIHPNPQASLGAQYSITEYQSLTLRKEVKLKQQSLEFAKGMAMDNELLGVYMFQNYKVFHDKTNRVPWLVSMQTWGGRLRAMMRTKWFWAIVIILCLIILGIIGQRQGWWDFFLFRWAVGGPD